jgi:hypothetical protein
VGTEEVRPFLFASQRDVLGGLAQRRSAAGRVDEAIGLALDPETDKVDGKCGAIDGISSAMLPLPGVGPIPQTEEIDPKHETIDVGKGDAKDQKDTKDTKEVKDVPDDRAPIGEAFDAEFSKEKDTSDTGKESSDKKDLSEPGLKIGGLEVEEPFARFGDPEVLPWGAFDQIARRHAESVQAAMKRAIF